MAAIAQILENERNNTDRIHLYREGLFLKAYQRSAFLFHTQVRAFHAVKKYYKAVECDVAMLGFPSDRVGEIFPGGVEKMADGHFVAVCSEPLDERAYQLWFASVSPAPEKKPRTKGASFLAAACVSASSEPSVPATPIAGLPSAPAPDLFGGYGVVGGVVHGGGNGNDRGGRADEKVLRELEKFSIESATPIECLLFLSRLKSELKSELGGG